MSDEIETEPLEIGLGSFVGLKKGSTIITGIVNGIKLADGILERICVEELDNWFFMDAGWQFVELGENNGEI